MIIKSKTSNVIVAALVSIILLFVIEGKMLPKSWNTGWLYIGLHYGALTVNTGFLLIILVFLLIALS